MDEETALMIELASLRDRDASAHNMLDTLGVPRTWIAPDDPNRGTLTVTGRLYWMMENIPNFGSLVTEARKKAGY